MTNIDRWLRLFLVIARCRSVSGAAEELGLTQSGLSRQLASLEGYLGQRLFNRHGRGMDLTPAGEKLEAVARPAFESLDKTILQLRKDEGVTDGTLRIATIHTFGYCFASSIFAKLMSMRPNINVSIMGRSSPGVIELVESGKADIGFVYDVAVATDGLDIVPLLDETMSLVVHERSLLAGESAVDLTAQSVPLVVFPHDYALRKMLSGGGFAFEVAAEVETVDAMLHLVSALNGQCILPDSLPIEILRELRLVRIQIAKPIMFRRVVAVSRKDRPRSAAADLLLDIARAVTPGAAPRLISAIIPSQ